MRRQGDTGQFVGERFVALVANEGVLKIFFIKTYLPSDNLIYLVNT